MCTWTLNGCVHGQGQPCDGVVVYKPAHAVQRTVYQVKAVYQVKRVFAVQLHARTDAFS